MDMNKEITAFEKHAQKFFKTDKAFEKKDNQYIYDEVVMMWDCWIKQAKSKQAEIDELKAKLEKLEKSKSGIVLTCSQLLEAFQFGAPDGESDADQMATEMAIEWWNDGHSGAGHYCYYYDLPEEGAIFLGEEQEQVQ